MRRAAALALVILFAGCTARGSGSPAGSGPVDLQGAWVLVSGNGPAGALALVDGTRVTLSIQGSQVTGIAACNQYGGTVAVAGNAIHFSSMSTTEMACAEPIMTLEAAYWQAFALVTRVVRDGDALTLSGPGARLDFELAPPIVDEALVGTTWTLDSLIFGEVVSSVQEEPQLTLADDGTFTATTGCSALGGSYQVDGEAVHVTGAVDHAPQACAATLAQQHDLILAVLGDDFTFSIDGTSLTIIGPGNQGLGYRAAGK